LPAGIPLSRRRLLAALLEGTVLVTLWPLRVLGDPGLRGGRVLLDLFLE